MERLGWITNCGRGDGCLQPWLEHSVAEIPARLTCASCGREVELVAAEAELEAVRDSGDLVAWPVVPPIAVGAPVFGEVPLPGSSTGPGLGTTPKDTRPEPSRDALGTLDVGGSSAPSDGGWSAVQAPDLAAAVESVAPAPDESSARPPRAAARPVADRPWHVELESGERIAIDKPTMIVGRSRTCDVIIPSAKVSRQHATLTLVGAELFIEDLGSANGTWKDDRRVSREALAPGDEVRISDATLRFEQE
jgi:hypothetical protein